MHRSRETRSPPIDQHRLDLISTIRSRAFHRCYVGDAPDQWRKCSDKYFPKKQHDSRYQNKNKKGEIYQPPPKPGGLRHLDDVTAPAELWPVTYLYEKGPPNATEISSNVIDCKKDKC